MENEKEKNEAPREVVLKEKEVIKEIKKSKSRSPSLLTIVICVIAFLVLFGGVGLGITKIFETQEKVLKLGLEDVGELVTQTCHTVVLEDSREARSFFDLFEIPFTESRQIFSYDFDVDASIDFSKIEIENIDDNKKEITVKLPHAKIFKTVLLPNTFKSYLDSSSLFSRIDLTEHNEALLKMESSAETQCLASNLLQRADENAQLLLSAMIKSEKKYKKYNIVFNYIEEETEEEDSIKSNLLDLIEKVN